MSIEISGGKLRRIMRLADENGRFKMMAIDQRGSMQRAIAEATGKSATYDQVAEMKKLITRHLSPFSTAVLTEPIFGYPYSLFEVPPRIGLLLAYEQSGYVDDGVGENERASLQIPNWSMEKAIRAGADATKLLVYYNPDASAEACDHQKSFVRDVGDLCEKFDLPFLLEFVGYSLTGGSTKTVEFAKRKPEIVIRSVEEFTKPEYKVDILKVEFPADLKFTAEYKDRSFHTGESAYSIDQVHDFCKKLNDVSTLPWVILSAGVDIEEFIENVKIACEHGASGFLCGRAIWKDAVPNYPDVSAVVKFLETEGSENFRNSNSAAENALPWFDHKKFGGLKNVGLAKQDPNWFEIY